MPAPPGPYQLNGPAQDNSAANAANVSGTWAKALADANNAAATQQAGIAAGASTHNADVGAAAQQYAAGVGAQTTAQGNQLASDTSRANTTGTNATTAAGNQLAAQTTQQGNQLASDTSRYNTDSTNKTTSEGNQLAAQTSTANTSGTNAASELNAQTAANAQMHGQDLQFQAAQLPIQFAQSKFNTLLPMFQSAFNNGQGTVGGTPNLAPAPNVTVGGVYTPQQTAEQINAAQAHNAQLAATQDRQAQQSNAAKGSSSRSPILAALMQQDQAARMGADASSAQQIGLANAQANATQQTASEGLRSQVWNQANQQQIDATKNQQGYSSALLAALAGLS